MGYGVNIQGKQSTMARKFLKYMQERKYPNLQYIDNGGEKKISSYWLDGFVSRPNHKSGDLAIEVQGW